MNLKIHENSFSADNFISLARHQSQTPHSFFEGTPVLHYHAHQVKIVVPTSHLKLFPIFLNDSLPPCPYIPITKENGEYEPEHLREVLVEHVDLWIHSEALTLYNRTTRRGVSIPYPSISIHAIRSLRIPKNANELQNKQGVYLHIPRFGNDEEPADEDPKEPRLFEVTIIPNPIMDHGAIHPTTSTPAKTGYTHTQTMFLALTACADLHPDPKLSPSSPNFDVSAFEDDGDGPILFEGSVGYESTAFMLPGAAESLLGSPDAASHDGWITADNVDAYMAELTRQRPPPSQEPISAPEDKEEAGAAELGDEDEPVSSAGPASQSTKWRRTE
ncbi:MAG: hypothetical protein M1829_005696 [Trizodia sp. TS-e1964]|nr:MAG: hypothetical protein M1829_005696 [Trizodia sp. TS-e1964]